MWKLFFLPELLSHLVLLLLRFDGCSWRRCSVWYRWTNTVNTCWFDLWVDWLTGLQPSTDHRNMTILHNMRSDSADVLIPRVISRWPELTLSTVTIYKLFEFGFLLLQPGIYLNAEVCQLSLKTALMLNYMMNLFIINKNVWSVMFVTRWM